MMHIEIMRGDTAIAIGDMAALVEKFKEQGDDYATEYLKWDDFVHRVHATALEVSMLGHGEQVRMDHAPDGANWFVTPIDDEEED